MTDQVTVFTQGYYGSDRTETMTIGQAAQILVKHGAFENFISAFNTIKFNIETNGQFKRASRAPGVWLPIVKPVQQ